MERLGIRYTSIAVLAVTLASCSAGFQGGVIPEKFKGLQSAEAISPESIQLIWEGFPGATQYRLYNSETNNPIAQPQLTSIVLKPNVNTAGSIRYALTVMDPSNGMELGSRTKYVGPVQLLERFNFKSKGKIVPVEASGINGTQLRVSWPGHPKVTYRVYTGERSPDGTVNYNGFISSSATVTGSSSTVIAGLLPGREYCSVMIATYLDNTNDGPDGTPFTSEISTTLNGWATGVSGTFGDSKIASSQICARTSSSLAVDRVKIYSQKAYLSTRPIFYVFDSDHPTENDLNATFETSIYQVNNTTGLATYLGKTSGTGQIISLTDLAPGRYRFYAIVTSKVGASAGSMAKKEIIVGTETGEPEEGQRRWIYVRGMPDLEDSSNIATQGYYPSKQQDGLGSQHLGSSVAVGDFDCDGKYDLAIGVPDATETSPRDGRSAQMGKVIVYYDIDDAHTPSTGSPRSQLISFDITSYDSSSAARDLRLGTQLFVANFNKDNQRTNQPPNAGGQTAFQCHDLVIGSGYGPLFVLYGKRNVNGNDGGLSYSGSTGYAVNPSSSCDTSSNVCSPALYTLNSFSTKIGTSIASGNFNGSGYDDLVATTHSNGIASGILVFRGSENGLIPPTKWTSTRTAAQGCTEDYSIFPFPDGPKKGYPYIPSDPRCYYDTTALPALENGWGKNMFGTSVGAFPNSYYDCNFSGVTCITGTRRIRDTLLIGNPSYIASSVFNPSVTANGRVYACRPKTLSTAPVGMNFTNSMSTYDMNEYFAWQCGYNSSPTDPVTSSTADISVIDAPLNSGLTSPLASGFGSAIQGIQNALLYDKQQLSSNGNSSDASDPMSYPNLPENIGFPGAVAIGASGTSNIFMYYGVHFPEGASNASSAAGVATRDDLGRSRNNYFNSLLNRVRATTGGPFAVVSENPCKIVNGAGTVQTLFSQNTAYREMCDIQRLTPPSGADWSSFGFAQTLFSLMGSNAPTGIMDKQSILAVPAPNRNIISSGSVSYNRLGSVQLYYQNIVTESNGYPVRTQTNSATCNFCRFSNGFSNAGSSSIDFDGTKHDGIQFGAGGVASGPLKVGSTSTYSSNADLIVGVPGYVYQRGATEVIDSGAAQVSFSHSGQFRSYQIGGSTSVASPWHFVDNSYGQEANIGYSQTVNLGDIDQDGLDDIAVRVKQGSENIIHILKGKASSSGSIAFNTSASSAIDFQVPGDSTAGMRMIPVGRSSTSQFPVYFITGSQSSYLYFGGVGGLIPGQPSAFATGGAPRKLASFGSNQLDFSDSAFYNPAKDVLGNDYGLNFAHGDFNGDGFEDLAIGFDSNLSVLVNPADGSKLTYSGMTQFNSGRVMVFYGGADNGFQVQADTVSNGGYPLDSAHFAPYSLSNSVTNAPCNASGACSKIQILYEGTAVNGNANNTETFGKSIVAVPAGACNGNPVHALLVQGKLVNKNSKVFIYKPQCIVGADYTNKSGLVRDGTANAAPSGGITTYRSEIDPTSTALYGAGYTNNDFGNAMASIPGIFGASALSSTDAKTHLVLSDSSKRRITAFSLTSNNPSPLDNCTYDASGNAVGNCKINLTDEALQGFKKIDYSISILLGNASGFGSTIASIGDVNGDGFNDVAISITQLTKPGTPNTSSGQQGGLMILFGGDLARKGLQALNGSTLIEPGINTACYRSSNGATQTSVCNPILIFAPQPDSSRDGAGEMVYLSRDSRLNFGTQNENLGSFLFGVPLRDTRETNASDRILRGGTFYVLP